LQAFRLPSFPPASLARPAIAKPNPAANRGKASIGTTASSAEPAAIAGICAKKAKGPSNQHHPKAPPPLRKETKLR
jgi:hypothetical protein